MIGLGYLRATSTSPISPRGTRHLHCLAGNDATCGASGCASGAGPATGCGRALDRLCSLETHDSSALQLGSAHRPAASGAPAHECLGRCCEQLLCGIAFSVAAGTCAAIPSLVSLADCGLWLAIRPRRAWYRTSDVCATCCAMIVRRNLLPQWNRSWINGVNR